MKNNKLLTVSEYAEKKGISKQAVYKQLNNKLKNFVKVVEGKKYIDIAALGGDYSTNSTEREQPIEQPFNNQSTTNSTFLEKQIEEKDKTINSLLEQVKVLQEQNGNLTELLKNSQVLLAQQQQLYLESKNPQEENIIVEETPSQEPKKKGIFGIFRKK